MSPLSKSFVPAVALALLLPVACKKSGGAPAPVDTSVRVSLFYDDGTPFAVAGVKVFVDDVQVGATDAAGVCRLTPSPGARVLRALEPGLACGAASLDGVVTGGVLPVRMVGDLERPVAVTCVQAGDGAIAVDVAEVELVLTGRDSGVAVAIADFSVEVEDARAEDTPVDATGWFAIDAASASRLVASAGPAFVATLRDYANDTLLRVRGHDTDGATFEAETTFFVEQFALEVAMVAPPSTPGLDVTGRVLEARLIGTGIGYQASSDAMGHVTFAAVPRGTYELFAEVTVGDDVFTASAAQFVNGPTSLGLRLLGLPDVLAGVPPTTVWQFAPATAPRLGPLPEGAAADFVPGTGVSVSSAAQDEVVTANATVQFPQGTQRARLVYEVISVEYPNYVLQQSVFNDNWTLHVLAPGGKQLFTLVRNVNAQVGVEPQWVPGTVPGTTGQLETELDVAALTAAGPVDLVLAASATNIGDSQLATTVLADLLPTAFKVQSIVASPVTANTACQEHHYAQTQQDQFSFPYAPQANVAQRTLTATLIGRPSNWEVKSAKVELRKADGTVLVALFDEAVSATGRVRHVVSDSLDQLLLDVTSTAAHPSTIAAAATPPADEVVFHVLVRATDAGGATLTTERDSPVYGALWRATLAERTGCRDPGGDEWASVATIAWLQANLSKLGPVNDLSGEHDRNLGHATHQRGRAIDFRQFSTADITGDSGLAIFKALREAAYLALNGDDDLVAQVDAWFATNRTGLGALTANATVTKIYVADAAAYALDPAVVLPAGWFVTLLKTGELHSGDFDLELPIGAWNIPAAELGKVSPLGGHLDHYHVALGN
ncbi:MAG: hypothetical protein R3F29_06835 [Planctomycetota bacterium]